MRDTLLARQSEKGGFWIPGALGHTSLRLRKFNSPMLDSTTLCLKPNQQKVAAILLYG